jgi:transcriptional regulator with XRE-family HTH domain
MHAHGQTIQRARERAGLSQSALARQAKVGRVTLNRIEMGTQEPTLTTLARIAKVLKVPIGKLVGG